MPEVKTKELTYIRLLSSGREQGTLLVGDSIGDDGVGGEGQVLKLLSLTNYNSNEFVIKVFHDLERNVGKENKIKDMITLSEKCDIPDTVCWPFAIVYDNGKFVGYLMKKANGVSLSKFMHGKKTQNEFTSYCDGDYVQMCLSIMNTVQKLHLNDILVGDINEDNFMVENPQKVFFIDTDSYQFGKYKCGVGRENYFSPEYYETEILDENSEGYSIIILIFKILMLGRDPFTSRLKEELSKREKVIKGMFPYQINSDVTKKLISPPFYYELWERLSLDLKQYFINIFTRFEVYNGTFDIINILEQYLDDCEEIFDYSVKKPIDKYEKTSDICTIIDKKSNEFVNDSNNTSLEKNYIEVIDDNFVVNEKCNIIRKQNDSNDSQYELAVICRKIIVDTLYKYNNSLIKPVTYVTITEIISMLQSASIETFLEIKDKLNEVLPNKLVVSHKKKKVSIRCDDFEVEASSGSKGNTQKFNYNRALKRMYLKFLSTTQTIISKKENIDTDIEEDLTGNNDYTTKVEVINSSNDNIKSDNAVDETNDSLLHRCQIIIRTILCNKGISTADKALCEEIKIELIKVLKKGMFSSIVDGKSYNIKCPELDVEASCSGPNDEINYVKALKSLYEKIMEIRIYENEGEKTSDLDVNDNLNSNNDSKNTNPISQRLDSIESNSEKDIKKDLSRLYYYWWSEIDKIKASKKRKKITNSDIRNAYNTVTIKHNKLRYLMPRIEKGSNSYFLRVTELGKTFRNKKIGECLADYLQYIRSIL